MEKTEEKKNEHDFSKAPEKLTIIRPKVTRKYGWKRDRMSEDYQTLTVARSPVHAKYLPKLILTNLPPVYDQDALGSCTANALAAAFEYEQIKEKLHDFMPSRLFIYYGERFLEDTVLTDSGAAISDGIKVLSTKGVCPESEWPYDISKFTVEPLPNIYTDALKHKVSSAKRVNVSVLDFKTMINLGQPVVFGFKVYESFETNIKEDGIMPMPKIHAEKYMGGHAVVAVGYDDNMTAKHRKGYLYVRNSWGTEFGKNGYFWMPYDYVNRQNVNDPWVISKNVDLDMKLFKHLGGEA